MLAFVGRTALAADAVTDDEAIVAYHERGVKALPTLQAAVERGSRHPRVHLYMALAHREQGDLRAAIGILRRAAARPSQVQRDLKIQLAVTLSWAGNAAEARSEYEELIRRDPSDRIARIGRATMLSWEGRMKASRRAFQALISEDPSDTEAKLGLAAVEMAAVRPARARELYESVLTDEPTNLRARAQLRKLKDLQRARVEVFGGYANIANTQHAGVGELHGAYRLRSFATVIGGYGTTVLRFEDPSVPDPTVQQHWVRGGVVFAIRDRVFIIPEYAALVTSDAHHHGINFGLAVRATSKWTLSANVRPGIWSDRHIDVLSRLSVEANFGWIMPSLHTYFYRDPARDLTSAAMVAKVGVKFGKRFLLIAGGGWQYNTIRHGALAIGQFDVDIVPRVAVFARYELATGSFVRHAGGLGLRFRW